MNRLKYEPRFKICVPKYPPEYFEKAYKCYKQKMNKEKPFGYICPEISERKCALSWLCEKFALLTIETFSLLYERKRRLSE